MILTPCPLCGYEANAHTNITDGVPMPQPGDVSLCSNCAGITVFTYTDGALDRVRPTPAELVDILDNPNVARAQRLLDQSRNHHGGETA